MKIAVTYESGEIFQHFGHSQAFKVYEVKDNEVVNSEVVSTNGSGHGALAGMLLNLGIDALICGGIGGGAVNALSMVGIEIYPGVTGDCDEAVENLLSGNLNPNAEANCSHHDHHHGEGHTCGEHCGEHHHHDHNCGCH